jgi:predicted GNAT family N-acyltransferase
MTFRTKLIEHGSPEYDRTIALRELVLRKPLGLTFDPDDLARERDDLHLTIVDERDRLLGCLVLTPEGPETIRMRQVAIEPKHQRRGLGRRLVAFSEEVAVDRGFREMTMHARATAVPFYEGLGYTIDGDEYEEVGIPHRTMWKDLDGNRRNNERTT